MMRVSPKKDGSRTVLIDSGYLLLRASVTASNDVEVEQCEVREPSPCPPPTVTDIRLAEQRAAVCETCEHGSNIRLTVESKRGTEPIYKVKCGLCSSCGGGLSLTKGRCKAGKWNK